MKHGQNLYTEYFRLNARKKLLNDKKDPTRNRKKFSLDIHQLPYGVPAVQIFETILYDTLF